jgi:hypothetical protein
VDTALWIIQGVLAGVFILTGLILPGVLGSPASSRRWPP